MSKNVLVLDAKYRGVAKFGQANIDVPLPKYRNGNSLGNLYVTGSEGRTVCSDTRLNFLAKDYDENTSNYNCNVWMTYEGISDNYTGSAYTGPVTGVPAVEFCRKISISVDNQTVYADIPNINILKRIYIERDYIDWLDPSLNISSDYALGIANPRGVLNFPGYNNPTDATNINRNAWSSTCEIVIDSLYYNQSVNFTKGTVGYANRDIFTMCIIPIVELD